MTAVEEAVQRAAERRAALAAAGSAPAPTTAYRLVHGEADALPGVAVDVYGQHLVLHLYDLPQPREAILLEVLRDQPYAGLYIKRHPRQKNAVVDARGTELAPSAPLWGEPAPDPLVIQEHGVPYGVRLGDGFRTGIFLDQRDNRQRVARLARDKRVLNLFAYTGGFSVAALHAGARHACCVDASQVALDRARENSARIGASDRHDTWAGDAFFALDRIAKRDERFDVVVLDPPSYATTRKRRFRITRDYPDLAARCLRVLAPGGSLLACVNHHRITQGQLRGQVQSAAESAQVGVASLEDLPTPIDFPPPPGRDPLAKSLLLTRR